MKKGSGHIELDVGKDQLGGFPYEFTWENEPAMDVAHIESPWLRRSRIGEYISIDIKRGKVGVINPQRVRVSMRAHGMWNTVDHPYTR